MQGGIYLMLKISASAKFISMNFILNWSFIGENEISLLYLCSVNLLVLVQTVKIFHYHNVSDFLIKLHSKK